MFFTRQILHVVTQWPIESQQRARRNAMLAATALTRGRIERDEVEEFLAARHAPSPLEGPDLAATN